MIMLVFNRATKAARSGNDALCGLQLQKVNALLTWWAPPLEVLNNEAVKHRAAHLQQRVVSSVAKIHTIPFHHLFCWQIK